MTDKEILKHIGIRLLIPIIVWVIATCALVAIGVEAEFAVWCGYPVAIIAIVVKAWRSSDGLD